MTLKQKVRGEEVVFRGRMRKRATLLTRFHLGGEKIETNLERDRRREKTEKTYENLQSSVWGLAPHRREGGDIETPS